MTFEQRLALRVLYATGMFSFAELSSLLGLSESEVLATLRLPLLASTVPAYAAEASSSPSRALELEPTPEPVRAASEPSTPTPRKPRKPYKRNAKVQARIDAAQALCKQGKTLVEIAAHLGVSVDSVRWYLRATP